MYFSVEKTNFPLFIKMKIKEQITNVSSEEFLEKRKKINVQRKICVSYKLLRGVE